MKLFKEYKTTENEDGTINIHDVEIFVLGKHRGKKYDEEWAQATIAKQQEMKDDTGYLPTAFVRHGGDDVVLNDEDEAARGFLDNFKLEGEYLITDIIKVQPDFFEQSLKKRKYPYRSVEIPRNDNTRIGGLALLGKTAPFHKLPPMEFAQNEDVDQFVFSVDEQGKFQEVNVEAAVNLDENVNMATKLLYKIIDLVYAVLGKSDKSDDEKSTAIKEILTQSTELIGDEANNFKEENKMSKKFTEEELKAVKDEQREQFKEEHGVYPEEAIAQNKQYKEEQEKAKKNAHKSAITSFAEKLKKYSDKSGVVPAIVDSLVVPFMESIPVDSTQTIKFQEEGKEVEKSQMEFFQSLIEEIVEYAEGGKLFVSFGESEDGKNGDPLESFGNSDDKQKSHEQAVKLAVKETGETEGEKFQEAYTKHIFALADKKE